MKTPNNKALDYISTQSNGNTKHKTPPDIPDQPSSNNNLHFGSLPSPVPIASKIISHITSNITINYLNIYKSFFNTRENSILSWTNSNQMNIDIWLTLLEKHDTETGVVDFLINLMQMNYLNESFFYLNQLCTMITYKKYTSSWEKYIIDKAENHLKFSWYITLLLRSYATTPKIQSITFYIEETMLLNNNNDKKKEFLISDSPTAKESRVHYYYRCLEFYDNWKKLCLLLFQYPKETSEPGKLNRAQVLYEFIALINAEMYSIRKDNYSRIVKKRNIKDSALTKTNEELMYNKGYLLPFSNPNSNLDKHSFIIVNIIPKYSSCFNTKERVPIFWCCECIEMSECDDDFYTKYADPKFFDSVNESNQININESVSFNISRQVPILDGHNNQMFDKWNNLEKFFSKAKISTRTEKNKNKAADNPQKDGWISNWIENDFVVINYNPEKFNPFGKLATEKEIEIKAESNFNKFKTYTIKSFIAKANDDLNQEIFAMQIIKKFNEILKPLDIRITTYEILMTSSSSGLIEFIPNTNSIDGILKKLPQNWSIYKFYRYYFREDFKEIQYNFARSWAGFCLLSYYILIKDRHNGASPKNWYFEKAVFKITQEYVDIWGGVKSEVFRYFKGKIIEGIIELKKHYDIWVTIIKVMANAGLNCYKGRNLNDIVKDFQGRFWFELSDAEVEKAVDRMIEESIENFWTKKYDYFQYLTNNILY